MVSKIIRILPVLFVLTVLSCVPHPRPAREPLSYPLARIEPLVAAERYSEAVDALEEVARIYPDSPRPLIEIGRIYLDRHRWLLAEDAFNRALARGLNNPAAVAGLAEALFNQDRLADALKLWQEVAAAHPELPGVFTGLGRTHLWRFEFEPAKAAFEAQQTHNVDPEARWYLAALDAPLDWSTAMDGLQAIPDSAANGGLPARRDYLLAALSPFDAESPPQEVAKATGIALAQVQLWPLAVNALTIALEGGDANTPDAETLAFLGHALVQAGRPALDLFEQAQRADPDSALPLYFQGLYLRRQGAIKSAATLFEEALALDPDNTAIYVELAQTRAQQGDLAAAEVWYLAALEVAENDAQSPALWVQRVLVRFYAERGYRMAEAGIPAAEALIEAEPNDAEAYDLLGWMQFLSGALDDSEASLRRALELEPGLSSARYHLARQLESQGQRDPAVAEYRRVVDLDTSGAFRERALRDLQRLE